MTPGSRHGSYEILGSLGAGGMGEVYRAVDTNLKRQVAIKMLPAAVATDAERLGRFQREAEMLAALNHPNIAHIFGLEKSGGTFALAMELVEGPTLADRIARGAVPPHEAISIARQIADALESAHEQGISIAISSPRTSRFAVTAPSKCWTSGSRRRWIRTRGAGMPIRARR
jgi:serine/threonine protein kinase